MDKSKKKIISIILAFITIIAVCAPCALGVSAYDGFSGSLIPDNLVHSFSTSDSSRSVNDASISTRSTRSTYPQFYARDGYVVSQANYVFGSISPYGRVWTKANNIVPCIAMFITPGGTSSTNFYGPYLISTDPDGVIFYLGNNRYTYNHTYTYLDTTWYINTSMLYIGTGQTITTSLNTFVCQTFEENVLTVLTASGASLEPIENPPDDDEDEDEYEGYNQFEASVYFTNQKLHSDSSYTSNNTPINIPSSSIDYTPFSDIAVGLLGDNLANIFNSNSVITGQIQLDYVNSFGADYQYPPFDSVTAYLVSSSEIKDAQIYEIPSGWTQKQNLGLYQDTAYRLRFIYDYYFVFPDDLSTVIGFIPVNIVFQFNYAGNQGAGRQSQITYKFLYYTLYYVTRSSSSDPLPSAPDIQLPDNNQSVQNDLQEEFKYYDNVWSQAGDLSEMDDLVNDITGDILNDDLISSLNLLATSMNYQGTDFNIKLPSASIPAIGNIVPATQLWQEQTIPFKYYLDGMPTIYKTIIGWIVLFSCASFVFIGSWAIIKKIFSGDISAN